MSQRIVIVSYSLFKGSSLVAGPWEAVFAILLLPFATRPLLVSYSRFLS